MTTLTSLLVPCEFDPTLWTDVTLGRIVHNVAQHVYYRNDDAANTALAELPEELPSDIATARVICMLWMCNQSHDPDSALELFERERKIIDPSTPLGAYAQYQAAVALLSARRYEDALDLLAVVEYTFREFDENVALALAYGVIGGILNNLGDIRASVTYFATSHELLVAYGSDRQIIRASYNLVFAYAVIGRYDDAMRIALEIHARLSDETDSAERSLVYGRLEYCSELIGRYEDALEWNAKHIELARQHQQDQLLVCLEIDHAFFALRLKRFEEAQRVLSAIPEATEVAIDHYKLRWAFVRGLYAHEHGDAETALTAFADAVEYCMLKGVSDELRLRVLEEIITLTASDDGLPRPEFAAVYINYLKQRVNDVHHASSNIMDAHERYAARLAHYQREREELLYTTILEAGEQTRREVSVSIHDGAGQELAVIGLQLDAALHELSSNDAARELVTQARERVTFTARELRSLSHALGTHDLERDGLPTAVYNLVSDLRSTSRISVSCYVDEHLNAVPIDLARSMYRTVQTLASNALQHAFATNIDIAITTDSDLITVRVSDDGVGLRDSYEQHGMGWKSVRARTELCCGTFSVTSQPNQGTSAVATFTYSGNA
jgi:signal transduction histidine kinase